jgi:hypothetical protein
MTGRRIDQTIPGSLWLNVGDYGKDTEGIWYAREPSNLEGYANLAAHTVVEHEEGTITVSPSILVSNHLGRWHGYLERGVWREC